MQDLTALPEASEQEDHSVRQAIEDVLARVNLADSQDILQAHDQTQSLQQAAEQKDTGERL